MGTLQVDNIKSTTIAENVESPIKLSGNTYTLGPNGTFPSGHIIQVQSTNWNDGNQIYDTGEITETLSYGFEYRFDLKDAHGLSLTGSFVELTNEQVWINNADDPRYFDSHLIDYSFYNLGLKYRINMLSNLEFKHYISLSCRKSMGFSC